MLSAGEPQAGEAVYTALESFSGTLDGRSGGFALAHFGQVDAGVKELRIVIVPGSGTGRWPAFAASCRFATKATSITTC